MILGWHLFLRLLWGFVIKILSFVGKHLRFLPKGCPFIFCIFYLDEQQVCLIKYAENEISNSSFHKQKEKKKKRERGAKT